MIRLFLPKWFRVWWCQKFHSHTDILFLGLKGRYICQRCWMDHPIPWEQERMAREQQKEGLMVNWYEGVKG